MLYNPSTFGIEESRTLFYQNKNFINLLFIKYILTLGNNKFNLDYINLKPSINNFIFYYLMYSTGSDNLGKNLTLLKNQYRPMRKGLSNMIRLHATGVVAVPVNVRIHILASSKDVIHS